MGKSQTFRHFVAKSEGAAAAENAVAHDWRQMVAQLLGLHRIYYQTGANFQDAAQAGLAGIVVCSRPDIFASRPTAERALQTGFATFAIPIGQRVDTSQTGDAWLCDSDTLRFTDMVNSPIIEIPIVNLIGANSHKASIASGSIRHRAEIEVAYMATLPRDIPTIMEIGLKAGLFTVPDVVTGWICIQLRLQEGSRADPVHVLSVPFFQIDIKRVRSTISNGGLSEAAHSELRHDMGRTLVANMARVNVYFDDARGVPALTPSVAAHIEACVANRAIKTIPASCEAKNVYKPFCDTRGAETSLREAIRYNGVVFAAIEEKFLHAIMSGRDGCGGLRTSSAMYGTEMERTKPSNGHLYFEVPLTTGRVVEDLLNAALDAATAQQISVREAIDRCMKFFEDASINAAEAAASQMFGVQGTRGLYLWWWLRRETKAGARLVANDDRIKAPKGGSDELADDWEAMLEEQDLETVREEMAADQKENADDFAASVREVVDEVMASVDTGSSVLFALVDRRFGYDEVTPEMMTSTYLTRSLSEVLKVTFRLPTASLQRHPEAGRQHFMAIKEMIDKYALTKMGVTYVENDGSVRQVKYPYYGTLESKVVTGYTNFSVSVSFVQGSEDAARINALLHVVVHEGIFTYVGYRSIAPLRRSGVSGPLSDLKYIVGSDPRCTPSWTPDFAAAMAATLRARKSEVVLLNASGKAKHVISDHFVGAYSDPRGLEKLATLCFETKNFSGVATIEQADYIFTCVSRIRNLEEQRNALMLLNRRKREILMTVARSTFPTLRELYLKKRDSKDPALHQRYGNLSRAYREQIFRIIEVSKRLDIPPALTREDFAMIHDGLLMDIVDTCFATGGRSTINRANVPKFKPEGGVGAKMLRLQLWTENHIEENEAEEAYDLEKIRRTEEQERYRKIADALQQGSVGAADRIWAIQYELRPGFTEKRIFGAVIKQEESARQLNVSNSRIITAALEATRIPATVASSHRLGLTNFYVRIKDQDLAVDFLRRFIHWASSPSFSPADLPEPSFWDNTDPLAFHNWTLRAGIRTSSAFGEIDWDRQGIIDEFLDILTVIAHNTSVQRSVDLVEMDYGSYQEAHSAVIPLQSLLGRHTIRRLAQMESEPPTLSDSAYEAILTKLTEGALIRPGGRKENILYAEKYVVPTPFGQEAIMKIYKKLAKPELRKLRSDLAAAETRLWDAQSGSLKLKENLSNANSEYEAAREAERAARTTVGPTGENAQSMISRLVAAKRESAACAADVAANEKELSSASASQIAAKQAYESACRKFGAGPDGELSKDLLHTSDLYVRTAAEYMRENPKSIDIQAFVARAMKEKPMLDRLIYIATCRVRQYIAPPIGEPQKPEGAAPGISSRSSDISSSDLGIVSSDGGTEAPHSPVTRTVCPDKTTITTIGFNFDLPVYRVAPGRPRAQNYFGPFTVV
jgi:hypothetical protein